MAYKPTVKQVTNSNPVLMEALAEAAHCTPAEAAEHFVHIDPASRVPVSEFLSAYATAGAA